MKSFDQLWIELNAKVAAASQDSNTVSLVNSGLHDIGKKVLEEAGEVWIAAEYQSDSELALEIAQLLYHLQVLAIARGIKIEDIYKEL
mgnify:CR=1 FL=1